MHNFTQLVYCSQEIDGTAKDFVSGLSNENVKMIKGGGDYPLFTFDEVCSNMEIYKKNNALEFDSYLSNYIDIFHKCEAIDRFLSLYSYTKLIGMLYNSLLYNLLLYNKYLYNKLLYTLFMNQKEIQKIRENQEVKVKGEMALLSDIKREEKSFNFSNKISIDNKKQSAVVQSENGKDQYKINLITMECECPDHQFRHIHCKHIRAAIKVLQSEGLLPLGVFV